jgi:microcystin-dependent protein
MAALDFPSSPTNGQVYAGYTYDSSKLAWALTGTTVTNMTVSDVAPSNPLSGDAWFDSSTASVFIYYNDGTSGQWVQEYSNPAIDTALTNRVTVVETQTVPTGSLFPFAGASSPTGYALCDGASVSTSGTYAGLFAVIGYTYGGSGASFNLPDLRSRVSVGKSASGTFVTLGSTGGAETHTLTAAQMPAHTHKFGYRGGTSDQTNSAYVTGRSITHDPANQFSDTSSAGSGAAHNNLQPYIVTNYIIKL